ncbi:MAG: transcriptional repressor [Lachnospiraceae bacterium]|nr:transcriptional repressor [Lachnospiraceae bacterium]
MKQQRNSKQRQLILDTVMSRCDHPTADQIYLDVRAKDDRISRGTVYRNLGVLSENGEITNVKVPAADRYDSRKDLHYHLFCTKCGKVFDAPLAYHSEYDAEIAKETGFEISRHRMIFEGVCPACVKEDTNDK